VSDDSEPEPDVALVAVADWSREHPRTAFLVVEVAESSQAKDRLKAVLYAAAGVVEYWNVDVHADTVEVHRDPKATGYQRTERARRGAVLQLEAFTDLQIRIDDILPPRV